MDKLLFLDIDGVLNNRASLVELPQDAFDPKCVAALNRITDTTGALIVVSSVWRYTYKMRTEMQGCLRSRGVTGKVKGCTPRLSGIKTRGDEIRAWLETNIDAGIINGDVQFVVIDDSSDITPFEYCFVQTSPETGLTEEGADRAIALLGSQ
ncbi:MAG: HAD domain-containing protein [Bacteroidota bacterium]